MKAVLIPAAMALVFAAALPASPALAKGCVKGAVVGGVAGHVAGHHGLLGAAAGCAIGHHEAARRDREAERARDAHSGDYGRGEQ